MKLNITKLLIISTCLILGTIANSTWAGPASPDILTIEQPDGAIKLINKGDEYQGWTETINGYTVIQNASGNFEYAERAANGSLVPSGILIAPARELLNQGAPNSIPFEKSLRPPRRTDIERQNADDRNSLRPSTSTQGPVSGPWTPYPASGTRKLLVILVEFSNRTLATTPNDWYSTLFDTTTNAKSVVNYYKENSFGKLTIYPAEHTQVGSPSGIVKVTLPQAHPNCGSSCTYITETTWIQAALNQASISVNFNAFDTNNNGAIDNSELVVYFILAGYERSGSPKTPNVWAHAWGGSGVTAGSKNFTKWALNGELNNGDLRHPNGVIAHELGHSMAGLPDLYDTAGYNEGLGVFSLMAGGSWGKSNSDTSSGDTPVGLDAWSRTYLGWASPRVPSSNGTALSFPAPLTAETAPVKLVNSSVSTTEYFLAENRIPSRWDLGMQSQLGDLWAGGLLIQHIDINIGNSSNNGTAGSNDINKYVPGAHQGVMAEEATNQCSLVALSNSSRGCRGVLFFSGNNSAFGKTTSPNSNLYNGTQTSRGLSNISTPSASMSAIFEGDPSPTFKLGDFNFDGKSDILVENSITGSKGIWYMNGPSIISGQEFVTTPPDWKMTGVGDFNSDGKSDIVAENSTTGERGIWYMNGSTIVSGQVFATVSTSWKIVGTGDFNYDGKIDILVENSTTGERGIWYMNESTIVSGQVFATVSTSWKIVGTGDFNYDGKIDILVENSTTGERGIWYMNNSIITSGQVFSTVPANWKITGTGDFNYDGKIDILVENSLTGEKGIWFMNGASIGSGSVFVTASTDWKISQ
ncbi:M6 family metalloprotease domain-containing protein [Simplicispira piscis]